MSPDWDHPRPPRHPFFTTVSGREIDLVAPRVEDIRFEDIAHHLAQICRYGGACDHQENPTYTVAQHSLVPLPWISSAARPYYLEHDAPEYCTGDDTTPKKKALPIVMAQMMHGDMPLAQLEKLQSAMKKCFDEYEGRHARVIHRAAGLQWPVPERIAAEVKHWDRVMLLTEWREFMLGDPPEQYRQLDGCDIEPMSKSIGTPWRFERARGEYLDACTQLLPVFNAGKRA